MVGVERVAEVHGGEQGEDVRLQEADEHLEAGDGDVERERPDGDDRRRSASEYAVSNASAVSRMWPAIMLARSRTASEKGRTRNSCTNSIGVTRT